LIQKLDGKTIRPLLQEIRKRNESWKCQRDKIIWIKIKIKSRFITIWRNQKDPIFLSILGEIKSGELRDHYCRKLGKEMNSEDLTEMKSYE
jgi:hypothetical protein